MKNLKISVANGVESKEAQELFFELGCTWSGDSKDIFDFDMPEYIVNWNNGYITVGDDFDKNRQEINLPELRDMVVLKRNSIKDAAHEGTISGKYYVSSSNKAYRFDLCWVSSHYNEDGIKNCLKPIEKKEMKEYLEPHPNGKYVFIKAENPLHPSWIEIPEGADIAVKYKNGAIEFFKENYSMFWLVKFSKWVETMNAPKFYKHGDIFWQRHKQPEELPLADGEKSLNNQYAEIEKARQATKETEYLMQGKNGERLIESLAQFNNTDHGADFDNFELLEDSVNHPSHYSSGEIECIDAIQSSMTHEAFCGYLKGNVQKYMWRYENKGGTESLKKAQWYLNKLIEVRNETSSKD